MSPRSDTGSGPLSLVLLDTNFLLLPIQRRIDVFEEIERLVGGRVEFIVLSQVRGELDRLADTGSPKDRRIAKAALELLQQYCRIADESSTGTVGLDADTALEHYAKSVGAMVATNDRVLRRILARQGIRTIFLRKLAVLALSE